MYTDVLNIIIAFFEGIALIISPCILPILPIVLAGSLTGEKKRPIGIIVGFILMFTVVTLFSRTLIQLSHISEDTIRNISFIILFFLGIVMLSTTLTDKFSVVTQRLANVGSSLNAVNNPQSGFWGGLLFGSLIGIIWTPCAGPILAAVIVQVVLQQETAMSMLVVIAFAIGAGLPMLAIALVGRRITNAFGFFREKAGLFRKLLGMIIILTVIYLNFFSTMPFFSQENRSSISTETTSLINGLARPYQAPEIAGINAWINSQPLTWEDLKGKVVLVDFWTYSCINCIRTLPYLKDWYAKYRQLGFVIIGVHSPEFQFEHDLDNVKNAVTNNGILYPVALDNRFMTWQNFRNQYWPAHYLIDKQGNVVYVHFGEGEYDITENNIRYLLGLIPMKEQKAKQVFTSKQTPETYFGYLRMERFSSPEPIVKDKLTQYSYPLELRANQWALSGEWIVYRDKIVAASSGSSIKLHFIAKQVYAVMGAKPTHPVILTLTLNGKPITEDSGSNVRASQIKVIAEELYTLVQMRKGNEGILEITASHPGLEMYTFTFGS